VRNTGRDQREVVVFGNSALSRSRVDPSTQAFDHSALTSRWRATRDSPACSKSRVRATGRERKSSSGVMLSGGTVTTCRYLHIYTDLL